MAPKPTSTVRQKQLIEHTRELIEISVRIGSIDRAATPYADAALHMARANIADAIVKFEAEIGRLAVTDGS